MSNEGRSDHRYATSVNAVQESTATSTKRQELPECHIKALALLCRICGRRCLTWRQVTRQKNPKNLDKYRQLKNLLNLFKIDVSKDNPDVHPKNVCLSCIVSKVPRPVVEWTLHRDGSDCATCELEKSQGKGGRPIKPANRAANSRREREKRGCVDDEPEVKRRKEAVKRTLYSREPLLKEVQRKKEEELVEAKRRAEAELIEAKHMAEAELIEAKRKAEAELVEAKCRKEAELFEAKRRKERELNAARRKRDKQLATLQRGSSLSPSRKKGLRVVETKQQRLRNFRPAILRPKQNQQRKEIKIAEEKTRQETQLAEARQRHGLEASYGVELEAGETKRNKRLETDAQRRREILERVQAKRREREVVEAKMRKDKELADIDKHKKELQRMEVVYLNRLRMFEARHVKEMEATDERHEVEMAALRSACQEMKEKYEMRLQSLDVAAMTLQRALQVGIKPTKQMGKLATMLIKDKLRESDTIELATGGPKFVLRKTQVPKVPSNKASRRTVRLRNNLLLQDLCQLSSPDGNDTQAIIHQLQSLLQGKSTAEIQKYSKEQLQELFHTNPACTQFLNPEVAKAASEKCKRGSKKKQTEVEETGVEQTEAGQTEAEQTEAEQMCSESQASVPVTTISPVCIPVIPPTATTQVLIKKLPDSTTTAHSYMPNVATHTTTTPSSIASSVAHKTTANQPSTSTAKKHSISTAQGQHTLTPVKTRTYSVVYPFPHCDVHPPTSKSIANQGHIHTYIVTPEKTFLLKDPIIAVDGGRASSAEPVPVPVPDQSVVVESSSNNPMCTTSSERTKKYKFTYDVARKRLIHTSSTPTHNKAITHAHTSQPSHTTTQAQNEVESAVQSISNLDVTPVTMPEAPNRDSFTHGTPRSTALQTSNVVHLNKETAEAIQSIMNSDSANKTLTAHTKVQKYTMDQLDELYLTNPAYEKYVNEEAAQAALMKKAKRRSKKKRTKTEQSCSEMPATVSEPMSIVTLSPEEVITTTNITHVLNSMTATDTTMPPHVQHTPNEAPISTATDPAYATHVQHTLNEAPISTATDTTYATHVQHTPNEAPITTTDTTTCSAQEHAMTQTHIPAPTSPTPKPQTPAHAPIDTFTAGEPIDPDVITFVNVPSPSHTVVVDTQEVVVEHTEEATAFVPLELRCETVAQDNNLSCFETLE